LSAFADIVYLDDSVGNLYTGDPATGAFTFVGNSGAIMGGGFADITFSGGVLYGVDSNAPFTQDFYSINTATAAKTLLGNTGSAIDINGMGTNASGVIYAGGDGNIYTINKTNGLATAVGAGGQAYTVAGDLEFVGSTLYLTSSDTGTSGELWTVNTTNAVGTRVGETGFRFVFGMAFDAANSQLYGFTGDGIEFTINPGALGTDAVVPSNIAALLAAHGGGIILGAADTVSAVPEPSSLSLLLVPSALIAAGCIRRRRAATSGPLRRV